MYRRETRTRNRFFPAAGAHGSFVDGRSRSYNVRAMKTVGNSGHRVLYVEDDPDLGRLVQTILAREGIGVDLLASGKEFLRTLAAGPYPDVCLVDLNLPDASGLELLGALRQAHPHLPAIVLTASEAVQDVVAAMKLGAVDYLNKPMDLQRIVVSVRNALRLAEDRREIARLQADLRDAYAPEHLVGSSSAMERVRELIRKAGPSDVAVLVQGESGTGKELVARALHFCSTRREGPFIPLNCAALSESLAESELFGHEKGAFTGAIGRHLGHFEHADHGTIFFDEIGDMPQPLQAKILRAIQERKFKRVGGEAEVAVDVRVICATHQDLDELVRKGRFRQDLFYRVNALTIEVPPLRRRDQDIPELAEHFLCRTCRHQKRNPARFTPDALSVLQRHAWPGNVRELEHAVERAILLSEGETIHSNHLPPALLLPETADERTPESGNLIEAVENVERSMILAALERTGWVKARAARALGITERMISYKMLSLGIRRNPTPTQG